MWRPREGPPGLSCSMSASPLCLSRPLSDSPRSIRTYSGSSMFSHFLRCISPGRPSLLTPLGNDVTTVFAVVLVPTQGTMGM